MRPDEDPGSDPDLAKPDHSPALAASLFTREGFDAFVTALAGTALVDQWDSHVAKVGGKVFVLLSEGETPRLTFKCLEESFELLTSLEGVDQAPYFARRKWVSATASELSDADLRAYVTRSYHLVAAGLTKKQRAELGLA